MKYVQVIYSTGMHHQPNNSTKLPESMSETFITLTAEEVTDAFLTGDWKAEYHSLIQKSLKLTGHCHQSGGYHSTRVLKSGG